MTKKYIFTSDYTASFAGIFGGTNCAPQKSFKKGTVYPLEKAGISPSWMQFYIASFPSNNINCGYSIPGNVVKEYTIKNQPINETMTSSYVSSKPYIGKQSSYLGESIMSKEKEENLKNAFAVIGVLFFALIVYWYIRVSNRLPFF